MEFTESFPTFQGITRLSPNGELIGSVVSSRQIWIDIYSAKNGLKSKRLNVPFGPDEGRNVKQTTATPRWERLDLIWSNDNRRIALVNFVLSRIIIWDIMNADDDVLPLCQIQENCLLGFERIFWAPDSLNLLIVLNHKLGIRLWRLEERFPYSTFLYPKHSEKGVCFSSCGRWMALLQRKESQDYIIIVDCMSPGWPIIQTLKSPESAYFEDICFSPLKEYHGESRSPICAWEPAGFSSRLFIFSPDGSSCKVISSSNDRFDDADHDDHNEEKISNNGYEIIEWSPSGWIGVMVKNAVSFVLWNCICQKMGSLIELGPNFIRPNETIIFQERITKDICPNGIVIERSKYQSSLSPLPLQLSLNSKRGASSSPTKFQSSSLKVQFSSDSAYLAALSTEYRNCLWIVNISELSIVAVLQQISPIKSFSWHDKQPILSLVTANRGNGSSCAGGGEKVENSNIYVWQPKGTLCIPQPSIPNPIHLKWSIIGDTLLVIGSKSFCIAIPEWATY